MQIFTRRNEMGVGDLNKFHIYTSMQPNFFVVCLQGCLE